MESTYLSKSDPQSRLEGIVNPQIAAIDIPQHMIAALRSDHAGEAGAVEIYRGILAVTRDKAVREFARHHLATEQQHLDMITAILPAEQRTRLLALCRWAGWITGALPALFGARAVFQTIDAVETFVDKHYYEQIVALGDDPAHRSLRELLEGCREDEIAHRDDARSRSGDTGWIGRVWAWLVSQGSDVGVKLVMRF